MTLLILQLLIPLLFTILSRQTRTAEALETGASLAHTSRQKPGIIAHDHLRIKLPDCIQHHADHNQQ